MLVAAGAVVMLSSRHDVERALREAENRSARNVLGLVELNVASRYGELLREKRRIVEDRRTALTQIGQVLGSTLAPVVEGGADAAPEILARLQGIDPGGARAILLAGASGRVVLHSDPAWHGLDLSELTDLQGRPLTEAVPAALASRGESFVTYTRPDGSRRFARFAALGESGLYLGVSDDIGDVERHVDAGVAATIEVLADMLARVSVVESGYVFIFDEAFAPVIPPPERGAPLFAPGPDGGPAPLLQRFRAAARAGVEDPLRHALPDTDGAAGTAMAAHVGHFRPLGWTIVSTAPAAEIARPATLLIRRQGVIFAGVLATALLCAWLFAARITAPLQRLAAHARTLPEQDFTRPAGPQPALERLALRPDGEVGGLARAIRFMDLSLRRNIRELLATTRAKERIESELSVAREIQRRLLPKIFPPFPECPQIDLHATLEPAREVGGDLFDFHLLEGGRLLFAVGDVAGKGVPSSLFMAITRTLLKAASAGEACPAAMLRRINDDLSADNPSAMFVTLLIGVLDLQSGALDFANAGHPAPLLLAAAGAPRPLTGRSGPAVGVLPGFVYAPFARQLAPGDALLVFTDGITEAMDRGHAEYGTDRLMALCRAAEGLGAAALIGRVVADVRAHSGGAEQSDDLTVLCLRWNGPDREVQR